MSFGPQLLFFVKSWLFCIALVELLGNDSLVGGVACSLLSYCADIVMAFCIYIIQNVWYFIVSPYSSFFFFFFSFSFFVVFTLVYIFIYLFLF